MATTVAFRTLDDAGKLPDNYVNPYYLEDLKRRVSVARAGGKLYALLILRCLQLRRKQTNELSGGNENGA